MAQEVQIVRECIKKELNNSFCESEWKEHNERFGELKMEFSKEPSLLTREGKPLAYSCVFTPDSEEANESRTRIYNLSDERQRENFDLLFSTLKNNMRKWWS